MSWFRKLSVDTWDDWWFQGLTSERKLTWLNLLTGSQSRGIGLNRLSLAKVQQETKLSKTGVSKAIAAFEESKRIVMDHETGLMWIPRWLRHNPIDNPNGITFYRKQLARVLPHPFACALQVLLFAYEQIFPSTKQTFTPKTALFVRDDLRCQYCGAEPENISGLVLENAQRGVGPKADGSGYFELQVTACSACQEKRKTEEADAFDGVFIEGRSWSSALTVEKLATSSALLSRFEKLFKRLPKELQGVAEIADLVELGRVWGVVPPGLPVGSPGGSPNQIAVSSKQVSGRREKEGEENAPDGADSPSGSDDPGSDGPKHAKVTPILTPTVLAEAYNLGFAEPTGRPRVNFPIASKYERAARPVLRERPDPAYWRTVIGKMRDSRKCVQGAANGGWAGADFMFMLRHHAEIYEGSWDNARSA